MKLGVMCGQMQMRDDPGESRIPVLSVVDSASSTSPSSCSPAISVDGAGSRVGGRGGVGGVLLSCAAEGSAGS